MYAGLYINGDGVRVIEMSSWTRKRLKCKIMYSFIWYLKFPQVLLISSEDDNAEKLRHQK